MKHSLIKIKRSRVKAVIAQVVLKRKTQRTDDNLFYKSWVDEMRGPRSTSLF
jgi:hypothetical protein